MLVLGHISAFQHCTGNVSAPAFPCAHAAIEDGVSEPCCNFVGMSYGYIEFLDVQLKEYLLDTKTFAI